LVSDFVQISDGGLGRLIERYDGLFSAHFDLHCPFFCRLIVGRGFQIVPKSWL
jgi:hypothetical protein